MRIVSLLILRGVFVARFASGLCSLHWLAPWRFAVTTWMSFFGHDMLKPTRLWTNMRPRDCGLESFCMPVVPWPKKHAVPCRSTERLRRKMSPADRKKFKELGVMEGAQKICVWLSLFIYAGIFWFCFDVYSSVCRSLFQARFSARQKKRGRKFRKDSWTYQARRLKYTCCIL